jgi:hypothetical protein
LKIQIGLCGILTTLFSTAAMAESAAPVADEIIEAEHATPLDESDYGPQSPRDIDRHDGRNPQVFGFAPEASKMALCNIHLHESAEHRGGEFTTKAAAGSGPGAGFRYDGQLSDAELSPVGRKIGESEGGDLVPGDTVEAHFVYTTALATPGPGLESCFTEASHNPQLRVEAVVGVLVNDPKAADFTEIARIENGAGRSQLPALPQDLGAPVVYIGSTTGTVYNTEPSPVHVTWSVRPRVEKIEIGSLGRWFADNPFAETHAHGVRSLVTDPAALSPIE